MLKINYHDNGKEKSQEESREEKEKRRKKEKTIRYKKSSHIKTGGFFKLQMTKSK